jgi:hypothetical protein
VANLTRIKILTTGSTTTAPSNLKTGELAYSYVGGTQANNGDRLYIGTGAESGNPAVASTVDIIGGKYFTSLLDHEHGVLTNNSAVIVGPTGKVDQFNVDNLKLDGNSITSTNTDGNIVINPNNTGKTVLHNTFIGGTSVSLEEFIYDTVGGAVTAGTGITVTNDDAGNSSTVSITNTGVSAGTYGSASKIPVPVVNAQGQITSITDVHLPDLAFSGDSGTGAIDLNTETLTFSGDTGITTTVSANDVNIDLDDTTVSAGQYGSATQIAQFTVDPQGRLTQAANINIATTLNIAADSGTDDGVALLTDTLTIAGTTNEIETSVTGDTITVGLPSNVEIGNNLVVGGNLTVQGTTTTVESTVIALSDPVIALADDTTAVTSDGFDRGARFKWGNGTAVKTGFFGFDIQTERFVFTKDETVTSDDFSSPWGDAEFGNVYGTGADFGNVQVGLGDNQTITTASGKLVLDASTNEVEVNAFLDVNGDADVSGTLNSTTLTLTNDLAVTHGGTGLSSFTGKAVFISNNAGTAVSFLTGTEGSIIQFNNQGEPISSNIIDGGEY